MANAIRKAVGAKMRFDIFKRDGFACQYCGADPLNSALHIDHIVPVAEGGASDPDNLVTSCERCNLGKGARQLTDIPMSLAAKAADTAEREAQLRGYHDVMEAKRIRIEDQAWVIANLYIDGYHLEDFYRDQFQGIKHFVDKLGYHEVREAMEKAISRKNRHRDGFRYFCGICWNKIRANDANQVA